MDMNCIVNPPDWYTGAGSSVCDADTLRQCNMVFPAFVDLAATASGTLTFDVSASNFTRFQPVGAKFEAFDLALSSRSVLGFVIADDISIRDTNYLLSRAGLNLEAYGVNSIWGLSLAHLPELTPGAQDVTSGVTNLSTGTAVRLFGWLYGFGQQ